ncbi:unnamed protein product [Paramecium sonneborni]|uniref:Uncharacterized protein n=1 Tax=Paramecium sonneborni TaxID=65129 RepID=A0A8S1PFS8_9CILI|nr:unnamed protein product [Paramecium sonneborni]
MYSQASEASTQCQSLLLQIDMKLEQVFGDQKKSLKRIQDKIDDQLIIQLESFRSSYFAKLEEINSWINREIDKFLSSTTQLKEKIEEYEGFKEQGEQLTKTKFHIQYTKQKELYYIYNGEIISKFKQQDLNIKLQIIKNLEEVKYLRWVGELGKNFQKTGLWTANWKGEQIKELGGQYSQEGKKKGKWKETIKNYYDKAKVYEIGEYEDNQRKGIWKYVYEDKDIGGGQYDQKGVKQGKWIEILEGFWKNAQITYNGEYNMKGMKVGRWDIMYCQREKEGYKQIGGGSYEQEEGEKKIGRWVELWEGFYEKAQITYNGEYNMKGVKVGRWDIMYCQREKEGFKQIGGGSYGLEEGEKKIGRWVELWEGFYENAQVTYNGEYNMKGVKVGRWDILFEGQQIGGGLYDQEESQNKIGKWVELDEGFHHNPYGSSKQVTYNGEYNIKGIKIGRWNSVFMGEQIGGGSYDQDGGQKKIGRWVELWENFYWNAQATNKGEYSMNGRKVGRWDIYYCEYGKHEHKQIGGGSYDQDESQKKIGKWVELDEGFWYQKQVTHIGEYNKGMKVGRWDILFEGKKIGGGTYDQEESQKKIGKWVELDEKFEWKYKELTYNGEYNMKGMKIGIWVEMDIRKNEKRGEKKYDNS